MFGGRILNKISKNCCSTLSKIIKFKKKKSEIDEIMAQIFESLAKIFDILSILDTLIYQKYKSTKEILNYIPIISIQTNLIVLILTTKIKISKSLKVDIIIIQQIILSVVKGNLMLIKANK